MAIILDKWKNTKKNTIKDKNNIEVEIEHGYNNSLKGFYSFYSIRDAFSLTSQDPYLEQFRKIMGHLSVLPEFENANLIPLYNFIKNKNEDLFKQLKPHQERIKKLKEKLKTAEKSNYQQYIEKIQGQLIRTNGDYDKISNQIIPLRKSNPITAILLRFLEESNVFTGFTIACRKQPEDIMRRGTGQSVTEMKDNLKNLSGETLSIAKEALKERRKNFIFKEPGKTAFKYAIGSNNAILQFVPKNKKPINMVMGDDLLMKLATIQLLKPNKVIGAIEKIKEHIEKYQNLTTNTVKAFDIEAKYGNDSGLKYEKAFPKSFSTKHTKKEVSDWKDDVENSISVHDIDDKIAAKLTIIKTELAEIMDLNACHEKPWKFASQKKIKWVMRYNHILFSYVAIMAGETDAYIRHTGLNTEEHDKCYLYLRFYKRFKDQTDFSDFFKKQKGLYFTNLNKYFSKCTSLEELFNTAAFDLRDWLNELTVTAKNRKALITVLKVGLPSSIETVDTFLKDSAHKNIMLHPEIVSLKEVFDDRHKDLLKAMNEKYNSENDPSKIPQINDNALIRALFTEQNIHTNTDFIYKNFKNWEIDLDNYTFNTNGPSNFTTQKTLKQQFEKIVLKSFLDLKGKELVLWKIAQFYWKKVSALGKQNVDWNLEETNPNVDAFKIFNSFYTMFNKNIIITLPNTQISVKISARKMDDEFLYPEIAKTENRKSMDSYIKNDTENKIIGGRKQKIKESIDFILLLQKVKKELNKSFIDIGLVMAAESILVKEYEQDMIDSIGTKYDADTDDILKDYYLEFGASKKLNYKIILDLLEVNNETHGFSKEALKAFRNNALHYQLQNNKIAYAIRGYLENIIKIKETTYKWDRSIHNQLQKNDS